MDRVGYGTFRDADAKRRFIECRSVYSESVNSEGRWSCAKAAASLVENGRYFLWLGHLAAAGGDYRESMNGLAKSDLCASRGYRYFPASVFIMMALDWYVRLHGKKMAGRRFALTVPY